MTEKIIDLKQYRESLAPEKLLEMEQQVAEKVFNKLPFDKKIEIVLSSPWHKRQDIILLADNSREVVQALPEEEVYWSIKERGKTDSVAIITRTTHEQFQYLIDIDCWNKDRIDSTGLASWYKLLGKCNESKVLEWFCKADEALLISSLKKFFQIFKIEEESDISEEYANMPMYTLDGVHFFKFSSDEGRLIIMPLLNVVYQNNRSRFHTLVEGVIWDFEAESEAEAFKWRDSRIAEKGFPELDQALEVYHIVSDKEIERIKDKVCYESDKENKVNKDNYDIKLRYEFNFYEGPSFLLSILQSLQDHQVADNVQRAVCTLSNKIIIADCLEVKDIDAIKKSLAKATGYVNIGLEMLSNGEKLKAAHILKNVHTEVLFRTGYSRIVQLKERASSHLSTQWSNDTEMFASFFDTPWGDAITGIIKKRPLFFEGVTKPGSMAYRDFENPGEIRAVEHIIDIISVAEKLLFDILKIVPEYLEKEFLDVTILNNVTELKCSAVIVTVFANTILTGKAKLEPITLEQVKSFCEAVFEPLTASQSRIKESFFAEATTWAEGMCRLDEHFKPALMSLVKTCLKTFEEEFCALASKKTIDPKYITSLILKNT